MDSLTDESDPGFGYATVRTVNPVGVGSSSAGEASHSKTGHQGENLGTNGEEPLAGYNYSDVDGPNVSPTTSTPHQMGKIRGVGHSSGEGGGRGKGVDISYAAGGGTETLYAKVNKPPKSSHGKKKANISADLPPKSPSLSPVPNVVITRASREQQHHVKPPEVGGNESKQGESLYPLNQKGAHCHESRDEILMKSGEMAGYHSDKLLGKAGQESLAGKSEDVVVGYHSDRQPGKAGYHSQRQLGRVELERPGSHESKAAEYTDEEYIPSGDDSFSITHTSCSDEELILQTLSTGSPRASKDTKDRRWKSGTPSFYHPPHMPGHRSATPGEAGARSDPPTPFHRPASAPEANSMLDGIPFIQPSFIQQLTTTEHQLHQSTSAATQGEVYIFSENQADGSVQYYAATPVHSPSMTNQTSLQPPLTPPLIQQPATPSLLAPSMAHAKLDSGNIKESGYYSMPASSRSTSVKHNPVLASSRTSPSHALQVPTWGSHDDPQSQAHGGTLMGTRIIKLGSPVPANEVPVEQKQASVGVRMKPTDEPDVNFPVRTAVIDGVASDQQSLTADKVELGRQWTREQEQLKVKEALHILCPHTYRLAHALTLFLCAEAAC